MAEHSTNTAGFLASGGEMAQVIAAKNWAETPLGPIDTWSQSLRTTVSLCLASSFPIAIAWGPHRIQIYNDGYWPICGAKHPHSMGQDFRQCWASAWPAIGTAFESAERGETQFIENERMFLDRNGYLEETFFTFSFSPIRDESGAVGGLFHPVTETTARMLSERRSRLLRDLAAQAEGATVADACASALRLLSGDRLDLPFALLYLSDGSGEDLRLVAADRATDPAGDAPVSGCLREVLRTGQPYFTQNPALEIGFRPRGPYEEPPHSALVLRIEGSGVLVAGLSARLPFDEAYQDFCYLVAAQLSGIVATARARQEERARAEALAELDRAKTAFFSNVSHEFRTPLTLMLGPLEEWLAGGKNQIVADREEAELVYRNALRLLRLVNSLLDFSRLEAGRAQAGFEPVQLDLLTAEYASAFRSAAEKAGLRFIIDCPPLPEPVYVDRAMWEKIVLNLLSNAFKFTLHGEIRIALHPIAGAVELAISDTGTGIGKADLPRLFERFYRIEGGKGRTHEGTGIGLSLTRELISLHGGAIAVESQPGIGSTFRLRIPLGFTHLPGDQIHAGPAEHTNTLRQTFIGEAARWVTDEARRLPYTESEKPRILLAEDNADMRAYVERLLSAEFLVDVAADGAEALKLARANLPDLVLSDVMMPQMDGFALLAALRADQRMQSLPVILLSARAGEESSLKGLEASADDYLVKPFSAKELLARVRTNVELARLRKDAARADQLQRTAVAIDRQRRQMDAVLSNTQDFNYIFDLDGRFTYLNRALLHLWQKSADDALGKNFFELGYPEELAGRLQRQIQGVIATRQSDRDETPFTSPDGETRHYEYIFVPVFGLDGSVEAVIGSTRDITGFKEMQEQERCRHEQLRETARLEALGVMAGGIAHDFNNLLTGVMGSAGLLAKTQLGDGAPLVRQILLAAERAADLVRQILIYSGKGRFPMEAIDLNKVVLESRGLLNVSISRSVTLRTELSGGELTIDADRTQVQQIVMNLLINASDAIGSSAGEVTVRTSLVTFDEPRSSLYLHTLQKAGLYAVLEVGDSGAGMTPETLKKIFDPFFTTKFTGRGLGLASVLGILRAHGGDIEVHSKTGSGTTFRVLFPVSAKHVSSVVLPTPVPVSGEGYRILVVDDEPTIRSMASAILGSYGFQVVTAENGAVAVERLRLDPTISLILLDLTMPVMTGAQALPLLRQVKPDVAVVLSSGFGESDVEQQFASAGLQGFLHKPYTLEALLDAVNLARLQVVPEPAVR